METKKYIKPVKGGFGSRQRPLSVTWFKHYARKFGCCERCNYIYNLTLHHKDGNKNNDDVKNFELLCVRKIYFFGLIKLQGCHPRHHMKEESSKWQNAKEHQFVIRGTESPQSKLAQLIGLLRKKK